jgi:hypothetical protein
MLHCVHCPKSMVAESAAENLLITLHHNRKENTYGITDKETNNLLDIDKIILSSL